MTDHTINTLKNRLTSPEWATAGCWVHIFEDPHYSKCDENIAIWGPLDYATLESLPGSLPGSPNQDWNNRICSLIVGPSAWVQVFTGIDFTQLDEWFQPNQSVPLLADNGFRYGIKSVRVFDHPPVPFFQWLGRYQQGNLSPI